MFVKEDNLDNLGPLGFAACLSKNFFYITFAALNTAPNHLVGCFTDIISVCRYL